MATPRLLAAVVCAVMAASANAWGPDGHKIVAAIAQNRLDGAVAKKVESVLQVPGNPPQHRDLSWYAPLPDDWDHHKSGEWSKPCHYMTVPSGEDVTQDMIDNCPKDSKSGLCVTKCLHDNVKLLSTRLMDCSNAPKAWSNPPVYPDPCDLELVTHYVGDMHQPFHVDHLRYVNGRNDLGGNKIKISRSKSIVKAKNLHSMWDSGMLKYYMNKNGYGGDWAQLAKDLDADITQTNAAEWIKGGPRDYFTWIQSTLALSDDIANNYKKDSKGYAIVDQEYYEKSMETIKVQLQRAGVRLAALINDAVSRQAGGVKAEAYKSIYPGFAPMSFMAVAADAVAQPVAPPALALHQRLTLRSSLKNQKAYRVLAAAILAGVDVIEADSATDEFGQTPVLEVQQLPLGPGYNVTDPNNIAAHVLDAGDVHVASELQASSRDIQARSLYGNWLGRTYDVEKNYAAWIYPVMGRAPLDPAALAKSKAYFANIFMPALESTFKDGRDYLLAGRGHSHGHGPGHSHKTFADIALASSLLPLYKFVWDPSYRAQYPAATEWFERVVEAPEYLAVLKKREPTLLTADGKFKFCTEEPDVTRNAGAHGPSDQPTTPKTGSSCPHARRAAASKETPSDIDEGKRSAAFAAVDAHVKTGMVIGVGSGTTVVFAAERIGELVNKHGFNITACPSSFQASQLLTKYNIPESDLSRHPKLDVVIDGADQFAEATLDLFKGGGGALAQEKIVGSSTDNFVIIVDDRKRATYLGDPSRPWNKGVPVEVLPVSYVPVMGKIREQLQGEPVLRMATKKAGPVVTDNGNFILDVQFKWSPSLDLQALDQALHALPGVVETGLFLGMAKEVYMGDAHGRVTHYRHGTAPVVVRSAATNAGSKPRGCSAHGLAHEAAPSHGLPEAYHRAGHTVPDMFPVYDVKTLRTFEEFRKYINAHGGPHASLSHHIVLDVDLSLLEDSYFATLDLEGSFFFGCTFPPTVSIDDLFHAGAKVLTNPPELPFKPFRAFMYEVEELQDHDIAIYNWSKTESNLNHLTRLYMATHDDNVVAHLNDFNKGKALIGVMGGHAMLRGDPDFYEIAKLCRDLARDGFVVVTGGGPGAMEAANYGAYMADKADSDFETGYKMLQVNNSKYEHEYDNYKAADAVLKKFGYPDPSNTKSLGVATWVYGHEPFNRFTGWDAKLFSNAVREDILLAVLNNGVIIAPGAGGTRQEIWQDATANSYADEVTTFSRPQVFWKQFWQANGMFQLIYRIAREEDLKRNKTTGWHTRLYSNLTDSQIMHVFNNYREEVINRGKTFNRATLRWESETSALSAASAAAAGVNLLSNNDQEFAGEMPDTRTVSRHTSLEDFRIVALQEAAQCVRSAHLFLDKEHSSDGFVPRERTALLTYYSAADLQSETHLYLRELTGNYTDAKTQEYSARMGRLADSLATATAATKVLEDYQQVISLQADFTGATVYPEGKLSPNFEVTVGSDDVMVSRASGALEAAIEAAVVDDTKDGVFLGAVSTMLADARSNEDSDSAVLPRAEQISVHMAYELLKQGAHLPSAYRSLGLPGFRKDVQTYIFVTDAGPGHIEVTTKDNSLMTGVTVHTEYIDREAFTDKRIVEPYRLPAHVYAARVRLHVGEQAPCSAFIGRPVFEGLAYDKALDEVEYEGKKLDLFDIDKLKTIHMTASACTAMFTNGIADAKVAIEKMTDKESIEFMRGVVGNTLRDPNRQVLAAAFNVFTPIPLANGSAVTEKLDIARMAIKMTVQGQFDKVTWDGASNEIPSKPILGTPDDPGTLEFAELVDLVHEAHEHGLITYISAGITLKQVAQATYTGVDGIGIGTSLHYVDSTKTIGALKPAYIRKILTNRTAAAHSLRGRAAALLARLDYQYFEGSLEQDMDDERIALYKAVRAADEDAIARILGEPDLADVVGDASCAGASSASGSGDPGVTGHKVLDHASRLVNARRPILASACESEWAVMKPHIKDKLSRGNVRELEQLLATACGWKARRSEF